MTVVAAIATANEVQAQCGGGGGSAGGGQRSSGASMGSAGATGTMLSGPGSWAYDQMLGQAMQRQIAQQQYQRAMAEQQRRAENLAVRQYWAAKRREGKAKPSVTPSGNYFVGGGLASYQTSARVAQLPSRSMAMSLEFTPSGR